MKLDIGGIYYKRGDIVRVIIDNNERMGREQRDSRPGVIVQNDISNKFLEITIVVFLTEAKNIKKLGPNHVFLKAGVDGVSKDSVALCNQIMSIDAAKRISAKTGCISRETMHEIDDALKRTLGIED